MSEDMELWREAAPVERKPAWWKFKARRQWTARRAQMLVVPPLPDKATTALRALITKRQQARDTAYDLAADEQAAWVDAQNGVAMYTVLRVIDRLDRRAVRA